MSTIRKSPDFKKNFYEQTTWQQGQMVCGVDEVGRGCLAGPVVAAAAIIHTKKISSCIKDSKKLTPEERLKSFSWIKKNCWYAVGIMHHRIIDKLNIYHATACAMRRAVSQLLACAQQKPALILVDALPLTIPTFAGDIIAFPFGESKSTSIAAASIVAKVTRDCIMQNLDSTFPVYTFAEHKGYCTKRHQEALEHAKESIIHRIHFIERYRELDEKQLTIFDYEEYVLWRNC